MWCCCLLTEKDPKGPAIQEIAEAAIASGLKAKDVEALAALGTYGKHKQNISNSLITKYCDSPDLITPQAYEILVPMKVKSKGKEEIKQEVLHMFLPTDWIASVGNSSDKELSKMVLNFEGIKAFWEGQSDDDPKLHKNPVTKLKDYKDSVLPLLLHGDGGQFQRRDTLDVISFRSLLSKTSALISSMLICAVPKKALCPETMAAVWAVIAWNFKFLFHGCHPTKDHMGKPWPKGSQRETLAGKPIAFRFKGWLFGINPDLEYLQNTFKVSAHSFEAMCWLCKANKSGTPYWDFAPAAKWRNTILSAEQTRCSPCSEHIIMSVPGVVTQSFCLDTLHTFELGVTCHFIGNVFFELVYCRGVPGANVQQRWGRCWSWVLEEYKQLKVASDLRVNNLGLTNFCNPQAPHQSFPILTGVKAKQCRHLLPVISEMAEATAKKSNTAVNLLMAKAAKALCTVYELLDNSHFFPDIVASIDFREAVDKFCISYTALAANSAKDEKLRWNIVPKHHYFAHAPDVFEYINLKLLSTYAGETMVGLVCALGHRCLDGTPPHKVSRKLSAKYRLGQHFRLRDKVENLDLESDSD